ncbi:MAG: hypothetical protein Q3979_06885 [Actinomycetaceae bacterium]|nr:hypothetical protein [Actinomycetaceae bacterium]
MNTKDHRTHDAESAPRDRAESDATHDHAMTGRNRLSRKAHRPTLRLRVTGVLAASLLAAASLTACSLNAGGQAAPTSPTSPQSLETDDRDPTETDEPTDDDSTEPSDSSNAAYLCGGLFTEEFLKDELNFTPSKDKFEYTNEPSDDYSSGRLRCYLYDEADDTELMIRYAVDSDVIQTEIDEAKTNADGDWQPLTIDGQEGEGWTHPSYIYHRALWSYPDGSSISMHFLTSQDNGRTVTADDLSTVIDNIVGTAPEHNETAGDVSESRR